MQRLVRVLTVINFVFLMFLLTQIRRATAQVVAPVGANAASVELLHRARQAGYSGGKGARSINMHERSGSGT
jgi:hypothetical protein